MSIGLSKDEKRGFKEFLREYEDYKNLIQLKKSSKYCRDQRCYQSKYGENAQNPGPWWNSNDSADDMMRPISKVISSFFGVRHFYFIVLSLLVYF